MSTTFWLATLDLQSWNSNFNSPAGILLSLGMDVTLMTSSHTVTTLPCVLNLRLQLSPPHILWIRGRTSLLSSILNWNALLLTHCFLHVSLMSPLLQLTKFPLPLCAIWSSGRQLLQLPLPPWHPLLLHLPCPPLYVSNQVFHCLTLPQFCPRPFICSVLDAMATVFLLTNLCCILFCGDNVRVCPLFSLSHSFDPNLHWPDLNQGKVSGKGQTGH